MLSILQSIKRASFTDPPSCQKDPLGGVSNSRKKKWRSVCPTVSPVKVDDHEPKEHHDELLPSYTCSVMKSGMMAVKAEMDHHDQPSVDRRWKRQYVQLHGTLLNGFSRQIRVLKGGRALLGHGLQGAKVGWASDYDQRAYTIRLYSAVTGEQLLLRPLSEVNRHDGQQSRLIEMIEWIEQIQAAINISMDIDQQCMPTFVTLARTHYRHHPNMATVVLGQSKLAIQTCPRGNHGKHSNNVGKKGLVHKLSIYFKHK